MVTITCIVQDIGFRSIISDRPPLVTTYERGIPQPRSGKVLGALPIVRQTSSPFHLMRHGMVLSVITVAEFAVHSSPSFRVAKLEAVQ
jgi:hypothetical protein